MLREILQKHEVESSNELGQAQFAEVLQAVLQELADTLAKKPYVFLQNIKITNGAQIKKVNHVAIPFPTLDIPFSDIFSMTLEMRSVVNPFL